MSIVGKPVISNSDIDAMVKKVREAVYQAKTKNYHAAQKAA